MLLTIFLGGVLFVWTQRFAGALAAVLALFFYAFSPTLLAHGRFVTTDVAAACGVTLAGFALIQFLRQPSHRVAIVAGLALGTALLCKFSTILLVPFFAMLTLLWILLEPKRRARYLSGSVVISLSAALLLLLPYLWITAQYPAEKQLWDTYYSLFDVAGGPAGGRVVRQ
jgi:4-amino-4-deoxy-L-arabinose transferase-like glycosyltransferase